jgi:LacI family transcriptional regulator, galactose operon repressor
MARKKRVTHHDVARAAGVSTAVVSYVINNGPRPTSPEVRERVIKAIRDLDYHPNAMARGLRARRTNTIGYVVDDYNAMDVFTSSYGARILTGLTAELKRRQHYVLVYPMAIGEDLRELQMLLRSERLDGVVLRLVQDAPATDEVLQVIAGTHIPCVCIERPGSPRFGMAAVTYDDHGGAYEATRYLIGRGHRRIAHLSGDQRYSTARARLAGYHQALADQGLPRDEALIRGGDDWSPSIVDAALDHLLALPEPPTAIFAANDDFALRAIELLRTRDLRVPDDMAVIGFDDVPAAADASPPLTTVRIPLLDLGRRAADLLLELVHSENDAERRIEEVPVELVRRASA